MYIETQGSNRNSNCANAALKLRDSSERRHFKFQSIFEKVCFGIFN
ncbi:hypothetical protein COI_2169 [Mannheimia haemolytica serotype A2 str. OVINE]|nr:hypothetical protein COI_2169 [Mannheimia haemolytica serotype A2 str. OVINE]